MYNVRSAAAADLEEIIALDRGIFTGPLYNRISIRQLYDLFHGLLLVADNGAAINGYVVGAIGLERVGWMLALGVVSKSRRAGLGRTLLQELLSRFEQQKIERVRLVVPPTNNSAIALYRSLGFKDVSVVKDYFGHGADRLLMER